MAVVVVVSLCVPNGSILTFSAAGEVDVLIDNFNESHEQERIWLRVTTNTDYVREKLRRPSRYCARNWTREYNRGYRIWPEKYKWQPGPEDLLPKAEPTKK